MQGCNSGIKELCLNFFPENTNRSKINSMVEFAVNQIRKVELESIPSSYTAAEEYEVREKIKRQLTHQPKADRIQFSALYEKLKDLEPEIKKRLSILKFLMRMCPDSTKKHVHYSPLSTNSTTSSFDRYTNETKDSPSLNENDYGSVSSYDSPFNVVPVASSSKNYIAQLDLLSTTSSSGKSVHSTRYENHAHGRPFQLNTETTSSGDASLQATTNCSEIEVIKELAFCFHGIEGTKIIKSDPEGIGFRLNPTVNIKSRHLVMSLMELGYFHNTLVQCKKKLDKNKCGLVAQSLADMIGNYLISYYHDIANLDVAVRRCLSNHSDSPLMEDIESAVTNSPIPTLTKLSVLFNKHETAFKCLTNICRLLEGKRGGQLVSTLYHYVYNGNPMLHKLLMQMLAAVTAPLYKMICNWMINGQFTDNFNEFFLEHVSHLDQTNMWDREFILRKEFIPVFMKLEDAERILQAGRYIRFLHNVCRERPQLTPAQRKLKESADDGTGNLQQLLEPGNKLSSLIYQGFVESSKLVLHSIHVNFNFTFHFGALRKYMLLGQGDFIHCLMKALEDDLNKAAGNIHHSRLIGLLETALNSTNADRDQEILNRLNIKILEACDTESGWDAFCLTYDVDEPLNAIFKLNSGEYSRIFTFLWRVKRAEYFLCSMWKDTILLMKRCMDTVPETCPIFNEANQLVNRMLQFVNHFQYYIAFEVVEVSWCKFQDEVNKMESLDKIVDAHSKFISTMQQGCMLTDLDMLKNIRILLDYVLELIPTIEILHSNCEKELERRNEYDMNVEKFGTDRKYEAANVQRIDVFNNSLKNSKSRLTVVSKQYEESLCTFLMKLSNHKDAALQILGHRIDFNEYYKNKNKSLSESFKFCRQSDYLNFSASFIDTTLNF